MITWPSSPQAHQARDSVTPGNVTNYMECACYYGESAKNMHCRSKEHVSKFNSKSEKVRSESAFYKHLLNTHGGKADD